MIPKILHYVWVGKNPLPDSVLTYIASWKKYCPDYQIMEWNEDNFDIASNRYAYEAYIAKKWAFVSDFIRLSVLYKYGGIYLDSDVELIKNLDTFLTVPAFSGFESSHLVPTGLIGSEAKNVWIGYLLSYYDHRSFVLSNGEYDLTPNTITITNMTKKRYPKLILKNIYQNLDSEVVFFPYDYFCAKNCTTGEITITENTHAIHHFAGSWLSEKEIRYNAARQRILDNHDELRKVYTIPYIWNICNYIIRCVAILQVDGITGLKNHILKKLRKSIKEDRKKGQL